MFEGFDHKCLMLGAAFACVFSFTLTATLTAAAQQKPLSPEELKRHLTQDRMSEGYESWNYYASGTKPPGHYPGPMEGGPPDPKNVKQGLDESLPRANQYIVENPPDITPADAYEYRGGIYWGYFEITEDKAARADYAAKALADLNKAIELNPQLSGAYEKRARLLSVADFFAYFDLFISDFLETVRLLKIENVKHPPAQYDEYIRYLMLAVSYRYRSRAIALGNKPALLTEATGRSKRYAGYTPWKDIDTAIAFAKENIKEPYQIGTPLGYLADKTKIAYERGEYQIALTSVKDRKEFWDKTCAGNVPVSADEPSRPCIVHKEMMIQSFEIDFAKVYIKLKKFEAALPFLNSYLARVNIAICPEPFLVRAGVYRQLGRWDLVVADEKTAGEKAGNERYCYNSRTDWEGLY